MDTINKSVLMRFLNKIPDGYNLEYNTLNFDKAVLMYSTDYDTAYLFSKRYLADVAKYATQLLKESKAIESIHAYHINQDRISKFDWKKASKDIPVIIKQFETNSNLPENTYIYDMVFNTIKNERATDPTNPLKEQNPKMIATIIAQNFGTRSIRTVYQCEKYTTRILEKTLSELYENLIVGRKGSEAIITPDELTAVGAVLTPYFRNIKIDPNAIAFEKEKQKEEIEMDELPTTEVKFEDNEPAITPKPQHTHIEKNITIKKG